MQPEVCVSMYADTYAHSRQKEMDLHHSSTFLNFTKPGDINSHYIPLLKYLSSLAVSFSVIMDSLCTVPYFRLMDLALQHLL